MRIGPAPLIPAYPVQPERQAVYPKALGEAFVGNPRLKLPEVQAKVTVDRTELNASAQSKEATSSNPMRKNLARGSLLDGSASYVGSNENRAENPALGRSPLGTQVDVNA